MALKAAAILAALSLAVPAWAITIVEFPLPPDSGSPSQIKNGPDQNLWFAELGDKIGQITTSGMVTNFPIPPGDSGNFISDLTAGPDGAIWFTETRPWRVGRLALTGEVTFFSLPEAGDPTSVTNGPDGNLWLLQNPGTMGGAGRLVRMTTDGIFTGWLLPLPDTTYRGLLVGPDRNLWFTGRAVAFRAATDGTLTQFTNPSGRFIYDTTVGPDANIWTYSICDARCYLTQITTDGVFTEYPVTAEFNPALLAPGPDGAIWITEPSSFSNDYVARFTLDGVLTEYTWPTFMGYPLGIVQGPDRNLWVTEFGARQIAQVTP